MSVSTRAALLIQTYVEDCNLLQLAELYKLCFGEDDVYQELIHMING